MLAAKTRSAAAEATNQFSTRFKIVMLRGHLSPGRKVEKEYVAIVAGRLEGSVRSALPSWN